MLEFNCRPPPVFAELFGEAPDDAPFRDFWFDAGSPNYGPNFEDSDFALIRRRDPPFGLSVCFPNDACRVAATPRHMTTRSRPDSNDHHTLILIAPEPSGT
jgi:hypothetical protein